ncbi:MAG: Ribosomal RNA large subunit methyltransferase K/L [Chlamydiae bacterium]|nr:Ribosomal RNA large subunit methyltransferase K/L [Chlamydiota bacterium]
MNEYHFIDSGYGRKLERFGPFTLIRPCSQALWAPFLPQREWDRADAEFFRTPKGEWVEKQSHAKSWNVLLKGLKFKLEKTSFGHVGLFPEHSELWPWIQNNIECAKKREPNFSLLNLFGYSGSTTIFAAKCGAQVCHLDASPGMVERARENAALNKLEKHPIRWIVDDVFKFLKREVKRQKKYESVILDPPSFGRGSRGEVFKIETQLIELLKLVKSVLSDNPSFVLLTCHTPGISPLGLKNILSQIFPEGVIEVGELTLNTTHQALPGGIYGKWTPQ